MNPNGNRYNLAFHGYKHKLPGFWRRGEIKAFIEKKWKMEIPAWKWNWWERIGVFPKGDTYGPAAKRGTTSIKRVYTDEFAEYVIGCIGARIRSGELKEAKKLEQQSDNKQDTSSD